MGKHIHVHIATGDSVAGEFRRWRAPLKTGAKGPTELGTFDDLVQGKSDETRSANIATEVRAGKPPAQAAAIAYRVQREAQDAGTAHDPATGQFTTGPGGGDRKHHLARKAHHESEAKRLSVGRERGSNGFGPDVNYHNSAALHHGNAAVHLFRAVKDPTNAGKHLKEAQRSSELAHQRATVAANMTKDAGPFDESKHPRGPGGQFGAGGAGHVLRAHPTEQRAKSDVAERHAGLQAAGFKHEGSTGAPQDVSGQSHHYSTPTGSRAVVTHKQNQVTGRHEVMSHVNAMNEGRKKPIGSNAHKIINPGFAKTMHPGQKALTFPKPKPAPSMNPKPSGSPT